MTHSFLKSVLGTEGLYCAWARHKPTKKMTQVFFTTVDELLNHATAQDAHGFDTYFALGTFDSQARKAVNVVQMASLFIDIDCGEEKHKRNQGYRTQQDALVALRAFCKELRLPRPTLVNSGYGLHAYWPLTAPVSREEWLPVATQLRAACARTGFCVDPSRTADAASVLRVPGTHNYKQDTPAEVALVGGVTSPVTLAFMANALGHSEPPVVQQVLPAETMPSADPVGDTLAGNYTNCFRNIVMRAKTASGCAQLEHVIVNQADISEPLWRAGLSIATYCEDRDHAIHKMSYKYPGYDRAETARKATLIKGPYTCATFDSERPNVCPDCQHFGKIKSPIVLGREVVEAKEEDNVVVDKTEDVKYTIPPFPKPFFRGKHGGIYRRMQDKEGVDGEGGVKQVYEHDFYVISRVQDPEAGESCIVRLHLPMDGVREFVLPMACVAAKDELRNKLSFYGCICLNMADMQMFLSNSVSELQKQEKAKEAWRQFGWVDSTGTCFIAGDRLVRGDTIEKCPPSQATEGMVAAFRTKGTLEGWVETMKFYDRPGMEPHQIMIGLAFGAPLMEFQSLNAAALHIYSKDSGLGKTTGMLAGASIWGNPDLLMMQERDTYNSKMHRAEIYHNLPAYMDEMTNTKPQELSDWAYQLPAGMQRNRMGAKANTERARGKPWKTLFGTTGNTSIIERIGTYKQLPKAEAQRILEVLVDRMDFQTKAETDILAQQVKEHYGHAGVVYVQYLINHLEAAKALADTVQEEIDTRAGLKAENRFWSALVSRTIAGLELAKRAGLISWDLTALTNWVVQLVSGSRASTKDMDVSMSALVAEYMTEHYNSILRIKSTGAVKDVESILAPEANPRGQLVARYEYDVKTLYLVTAPFKRWLADRQMDYRSVINELSKAPTSLQSKIVRITRGVNMNLPPVRTLIIQCVDFTDDLDEAE